MWIRHRWETGKDSSDTPDPNLKSQVLRSDFRVMVQELRADPRHQEFFEKIHEHTILEFLYSDFRNEARSFIDEIANAPMNIEIEMFYGPELANKLCNRLDKIITMCRNPTWLE